MKDIFANLYNKVLSFFHQAESNDAEKSKNVACNRLKLVLMQDRTNLSPAIMERMRHELIDLLSKYLVLDKELLDLNLAQEEEQMALMLSIPVIRAKEESEIEEILKLEDEAKSEENNNEETDEDDDDDDEDEVGNDEVNEEDSDDEEITETEDESEEEVDDSEEETPENEESKEKDSKTNEE